MFVARLILLPLILLAACSRAPELATCRLVGEWKRVMRLPRTLEAQVRAGGKDPSALWKAAEAQVRAEFGARSDECFRADGTYGRTGETYPPEAPNARMTWRLMSDHGDRVLISIPDPKAAFGDWGRTFVFETPDLIREEGGIFDGMKYERVK